MTLTPEIATAVKLILKHVKDEDMPGGFDLFSPHHIRGRPQISCRGERLVTLWENRLGEPQITLMSNRSVDRLLLRIAHNIETRRSEIDRLLGAL